MSAMFFCDSGFNEHLENCVTYDERTASEEKIPKQSNVYEEIVRKGWEAVKKNRR